MGQTSLKKLNANRKNALQSTGPRTPDGKQKARWNALKHGLLAREVVIRIGPGRERQADFENLLAALRQDLEPRGALEEILVENIAVCYWRLRRVLQAENGEIRGNLDGAEKSFYIDLAMQAALARQKGLEQPSLLWSSTFGLQFLLEFLDDLKTEVHATKGLSKASLRKTAEYFGDNPEGLAARCSAALSPPSDSSPTPAATIFESEFGSENRLLQILDEQKTQLQESLQFVRVDEFASIDSLHDRLSLPEAADRILRYEIAIERQMYRALRQLERIQHRRKALAWVMPDATGENLIFTKRTQTSTTGASVAGPEQPGAEPGPGTAGCG